MHQEFTNAAVQAVISKERRGDERKGSRKRTNACKTFCVYCAGNS